MASSETQGLIASADTPDPLVLLPGMNCTTDLWTGCGLTDAITPTLDEPTIDRQVEKLLDTLPERFALAGLSLGGIVGMALCRRAPERVTRLCLMSTNAKAPTTAQREGWKTWRDRLAAGESPRDLQQGILHALLSNPARDRYTGLAERVLRMGDDTSAENLDAQLQMQDSRIDESAKINLLRMPVLLISGSFDVICPTSFHQTIAMAVPGAQLATVKAGHLVPMERAEEVGLKIRNWAD